MRRLNLVLLASLRLCQGRQLSFSIQEDLLAYPQFEIVFSDSYISEADALALLESNGSPTYAADFSSQTDLTSNVRESTPANAAADPTEAYRTSSGDGVEGDEEISETYELINVPPTKYLCSIPVIAPPPVLNQTATELAKAEEARELSRASARGWELVNNMKGSCLDYNSGWWSYSFCYGEDIVQFHALPSGQKGGPLVKDPNSQEYVLGRTHPSPRPGANRRHAKQQQEGEDPELGDNADGTPKSLAPPNTELAVKGDQRYLVQRLEGGTVCDLTGRDRTIEVQYHCAPNFAVDRIAWIKEVTTCTYLMMVYTPRLCSDVAFQPPEPQLAHAVSCRQVVSSEEEAAAWHERKTIEAQEIMGVAGKQAHTSQQQQQKQQQQQQGHNQHTGKKIGGVVVGGRQLLGLTEDGKPAAKLPPPRHFAAGTGKGFVPNPLVEILAHARSQAEGGEVETLSEEELKKLEITPETVEKLKNDLQKLAGDKAWKLEVVAEPGGVPEIRGIISDEDDEKEPAPRGGEGAGKETGQSQGKGKAAQGQQAERYDDTDDDYQDEAGSEEKFFTDDL